MSDDFDLGDLGDDAGADGLGWLDDLVDAWDAPGEEPVLADHADDLDGHADARVAGDPDESDGTVGAADLDDGDRPAPYIDLGVDDPDGADEPDEAGDGADGAARDDLVAGELPGDVLRDALADIGADDAAAVVDALADGGLGPRSAVGALDAAGIPARVEHADIGALVETVASGGDVLLVGAGTAHAVVAVDVAGGVVELEADGIRSTVSLQHLADAWADLDHEVVLVAEAGGGPVRLVGEAMVLAVDPTDLPDRAV